MQDRIAINPELPPFEAAEKFGLLWGALQDAAKDGSTIESLGGLEVLVDSDLAESFKYPKGLSKDDVVTAEVPAADDEVPPLVEDTVDREPETAHELTLAGDTPGTEEYLGVDHGEQTDGKAPAKAPAKTTKAAAKRSTTKTGG